MTDASDANDPTKYKRLAASLRAQVQHGILQLGEPLPIADLAAENGWARQTCSRALSILVEEGLLTYYTGLGYYVTGTTVQRGQP
jgi:DNA-binding GntR family transcriptional regulator